MSQDTQQTKLFFGRLLCSLGIALAVIGAFFVSVATNVLGMVLGMVGYALGVRRLGTRPSSWHSSRSQRDSFSGRA